MIITSNAFTHNGSIPRVYTCEGEDISPDLSWRDLPAAKTTGRDCVRGRRYERENGESVHFVAGLCRPAGLAG